MAGFYPSVSGAGYSVEIFCGESLFYSHDSTSDGGIPNPLNIDSLPAGTYTVILTAPSGCTYSGGFTVNSYESMALGNIEIHPITCSSDNNGSVKFTIEGGLAPYRMEVFRRDTEEAVFVRTVHQPGTHTVKLTGVPHSYQQLSLYIYDANGEMTASQNTGNLLNIWEGNVLYSTTINRASSYSGKIYAVGMTGGSQQIDITRDITFTNCTVYTAQHEYSDISETQWTVAAGFDLKLVNTVIESGCPDRMWQGIRAEGNPSAAQSLNSHALVQLGSGSQVNDAVRALESVDGGIIKTSGNSSLKNNVYGIYINPYAYSMTQTVINNTAFATDRIFENTNARFPKAHIYLKGVSGLVIYSNVFSNDVEWNPPMYIGQARRYYLECRGTGIQGVNSSFTARYIPVVTDQTGGYGNTYRGLHYGVYVSGGGSSVVDVRFSTFTDNFRGMYISGTTGSIAAFNTITATTENPPVEMIGITQDGTPGTTVKYGAYLSSCTGFRLEENTVKYGSAGIYIYNSGNASGQELYRNYIGTDTYSSNSGTVVVGKNSDYVAGNTGTGNIGLQVRCNTYTNTSSAISVVNGNMRRNQGTAGSSTGTPAGNQFHKIYQNAKEFTVSIGRGPSPINNFSSFDLGTYNYYQHDDSNAPASDPFYRELRSPYNNNVITWTQYGNSYNRINSCKSKFSSGIIVIPGDPGGGIIRLSAGRIGELGSRMEEMEAEYSAVVDKGIL
jgi:parallel beta-helix repeat protein